MSSTTSRGCECTRSRARSCPGEGSVVREALRPAIASCVRLDAVEDSSSAKSRNESEMQAHASIAAVRRSPSSTADSLRAAMSAAERLIAELRTHALVLGEVVLTSGATAQYYVDAKRAILRPAGFQALAELVAERAQAWDATAVGGTTMGADPVACAALAGGADVKAFFVRKESKAHGLQRRIEGPLLDPEDRCVVVEDVVTTGGSTVLALDALREAGHQVVGVVSVLDRLAGGGARIEEAAGAPYVALSTIDEVYPDRPDRA